MKQYKLVNNLLGWITFAIAAYTYCSTIESTASFWDCPEFITTAYKLEVGHPPGAPFFMLVGNLFSQFASDPSKVALMVNTMSALLSAACILFLFWTITHLARKLVCKDGVVDTWSNLILVEACGLVGALAYAWSDTFWFSAVEGEVYAFSSMFTAVVFWLILKWEDHADEPHSDRWLVLIAYLMGLSIGVHLLNLLCIPAIVLVYYYKRNPEANAKGSCLALLLSMVFVGVVLYGIVPGISKVGGWFELASVNGLGLPFNTGTIFYIVLLIACVIWSIYESFVDRSRKRITVATLLSIALLGIPFYGDGWTGFILGLIVLVALYFLLGYSPKGKKGYLLSSRALNTTLLCFLMLMIGYSSYAVTVIRSTANPPMDQNSPEDVFSLDSYLSREQYGTRPLFYGQAYTSQPKLKPTDDGSNMLTWEYKEGAPIYQRKEKEKPEEKDSYEVVGQKREYLYAQNMLFPRMYDEGHTQSYESWINGVKGTEVPYDDPSGRVSSVKMPTQFENLYFFLSYQVNFMYWRYFMWNFAGRQNDMQGNGELEHGNWITGFKFIDNARLGDQDLLPDELKENKGHNVYYCLPLLLGLLGLFWQAYRGKEGVRQFWVVFFLFFMTGLAIVLYLNQTPNQPRERDYAYAGSFYAFAIWIGLGVAALAKGFEKVVPKMPRVVGASVAGILGIIVPLQMVSQSWDDHDRSNRYTCRDFGQNYLMSLQKKGNPIIFTNGDNDTFPLWYNQETEGVRTDARVCNLSYVQTDWYIDQMKRPAYDSPALPITWSRLEYVSNGQHESVRVEASQKAALAELNKEHPDVNMFELGYILKTFVRNPNPSLRYIPTDSIVVKVDKDAVRRSGMKLLSDSIPDYMTISLAGKRILYKSELMILEMLANANWTRPLYMAITVGTDNYGNLGDYFLQEGLAYRIVPWNTRKMGISMDADCIYDHMMNDFHYGNVKHRGIYIDETTKGMCWTHRVAFARTAQQLIVQGEKEKARKLLLKCEEELPEYSLPAHWRSGTLEIGRCWALLGDYKRARHELSQVEVQVGQYLRWYLSLSNAQLQNYGESYLTYLQLMHQVAEYYRIFDAKKAAQLDRLIEQRYAEYQNRTGGALNSYAGGAASE